MTTYNPTIKEQIERRINAWVGAMGLQGAAGLTASQDLIYLANQSIFAINGNIEYDEIVEKLKALYKLNISRQPEADVTTACMAQEIESYHFDLSAEGLRRLHKNIFKDVPNFRHPAGVFQYAALRAEGDVPSIDMAFTLESTVDMTDMDKATQINHIADFTALLWKIQPFEVGTTRTLAVFMIQYLRRQGFTLVFDVVTNDKALLRCFEAAAIGKPELIRKYARALATGERFKG